MARTAIGAFGRLQMNYTAYGHQHIVRFWVPAFLRDSGVGTFTASGSPASLDELAAELAEVIKPTYVADSALAFGQWLGGETVSPTNESFVPTVTGNIAAPAASFGTGSNAPGAVSQGSWAFRNDDGDKVRIVFIGEQYFGSERKFYTDLGGGYLALANYILGSPRIISRRGTNLASMLDLTFDTNDGLTRRYRG